MPSFVKNVRCKYRRNNIANARNEVNQKIDAKFETVNFKLIIHETRKFFQIRIDNVWLN